MTTETNTKYPQITRALMRGVLQNTDGDVILACQALKTVNPNFPDDLFIKFEGLYESVIDSNKLLYGFSEDENEKLNKWQVIDENTDIAGLVLILDQQTLVDSFINYFNETAIDYNEMIENGTEECNCCEASENCSEDEEDIDDGECDYCENVHYIPMLDEIPLSYKECQMIRIMRSKNLPTVVQVAYSLDEIESLENFSGMYIPTVDDITLDEKEILMIRTMRLLNQ